MWSYEFLNVFRETRPIIFSATKNQAVIIGQSKIVNNEARIVNTETAVDQFTSSRLAERLGRDHEIINRHNLAGHTRLKLAQIAVAGKHNKGRRHRPACGLNFRRIGSRVCADS